MNDKPHVTVVYQDARTPTGMTCIEGALSLVALLAMGLVAGWWSLDMIGTFLGLWGG